jgi:hypothetical protein
MRSTDLPKGETRTGPEHVSKGANWEAVYQSVCPKTWMIWIKLNCLKSSGELETTAPSTQRLRSNSGSSSYGNGNYETFLPGTRVNETYQTTNGHPKSS